MSTTPFENQGVRLLPWQAYGLAGLACVLLTLITLPLHPALDLPNIIMLFLLTVALIAMLLERGPALFASVLGVALFDFFFVPPRFSFSVTDAQYLVTFAVMLAVSLLISHLTAGLKHQADQARQREQQSCALYELAKSLAGALEPAQVLADVRAFIAQYGDGVAALYLANRDEQLQNTDQITASDSAITDTLSARIAYDQGKNLCQEGEVRGKGAGCILFLPLKGSTRSRGVLSVGLPGIGASRIGQWEPLLEAVASLVATAIERLHFVEVAHQAQMTTSAERLRSSILSALSHDVRTPLTVLCGMAESLTRQRPPLASKAQETAQALHEQALHLSGMVSNLLDMARLQAGEIRLHREWQPLEEVIGASIKLLGNSLNTHPVKVELDTALPLLNFDAVLLERVFCNLLENAAKYAPPATTILIQATATGDKAQVTIHNAGTGFPPAQLTQVFELFRRGQAESAVPGVGVGLAICRAIIEAHGGEISASNPESGGASVCFTLPCGTPPSIEAEILDLQPAPATQERCHD